jgi:hypothetical protein
MSEQLQKKVVRKRVPQACDHCRSKKLKCDGSLPSCSRCSAFGGECLYTVIQKEPKVRKPPQKKGPKKQNKPDIAELGKRMLKLESLMSSIIEKLSPGTIQPSTEIHFEDPLRSISPDESAALGPALSQSPLSPTIRAKSPVDRYFGTQHSFSVLSGRGIQRLTKLTGDPKLADKFAEFHYKTTAVFLMKNNLWLRSIDKCDLKPIPCREVTQPLVDVFFSDIHICDLFVTKEEIDELFSRYSLIMNNVKSHTGRRLTNSDFLSMNVIIAIGAIILMEEIQGKDHERLLMLQSLHENHIQNAMYHFNRASVISEGLRSIQALLLLTMYAEMVKCFPQSYMLVSTIVRYAQEMGLHRREALIGLPPEEAMTRRRLWLFIIVVDIDCCFKSGKPPMIQKFDVSSVHLGEYRQILFHKVPDSITDELLDPNFDFVGTVQNMSSEEYLRGPVRYVPIYHYAHILNFFSSLYSELYSAKSLDGLSFEEILIKIDDLNNQFDQLMMRLPGVSSHEDLKRVKEPLIRQDLRYSKVQYYSSVVIINKLALTKVGLHSEEDGKLSPLQAKLVCRCLEAARNIMELLSEGERMNLLFSNHISYHFFSAFFTLFTGCVEFPTSPSARADLELMMRVKSDILMKRAVHCVNMGDTVTFTMINYCLRAFMGIAFMVYNNANDDKVDLTMLDQEFTHFDQTLSGLTCQVTSVAMECDPMNILMKSSLNRNPNYGESTCTFNDRSYNSHPELSQGAELLNRQFGQSTNQYWSVNLGRGLGSSTPSQNGTPSVPDILNDDLVSDNPLINPYGYTLEDFETEKNSTIFQHLFAIPDVFLNMNDQQNMNFNDDVHF